MLAADVTICVSRLRADELQPLVPGSGRTDSPRPARRTLAIPGKDPARTAGRGPRGPGAASAPVSWLYRFARGPRRLGAHGQAQLAFPDASIVVVGRVRDAEGEAWWDGCSRFLSRPNVHATGMAAPGGTRPSITRHSTSA